MDEHEPPDGVTPADAAAARRIADELRTFVEDGGPNVQALWNRAMDELAENGSVTLTPADGDALLTAMVEDATTPEGLAAPSIVPLTGPDHPRSAACARIISATRLSA